MNQIPDNLKYTKDHEWIRQDGPDQASVGITHHAQQSLGDITFLELPAVGDTFEAGDTFGVVESVKAASDLYMPMAGEVIAVNEELEDAPEAINTAPYDSWIIQIRPANADDVSDLMDAAAYAKLI